MNEPGKYDELCSSVREQTRARGVILMVIDGNLGAGFSVQADPLIVINLPSILRHLAYEIETQTNQVIKEIDSSVASDG